MQFSKVKEEDHLYEANNAAAKIFEWKGHILRAENQDQCKFSNLWTKMKHL